MYYLNDQLLQESFLRLRKEESGGKIGTERTSALFQFLAFNALQKRTGMPSPIDLDPDSSAGKINRDLLTTEFCRLSLIKGLGINMFCHVPDLGKVNVDNHSPEKRFSSNFLTVTLKKATTSDSEVAYPSRPSNPLLILGPKATKLTWGIGFHPNWKQNLPVFLEGRKTRTPFTDLACFVLRQRGYEDRPENLQTALSIGLDEVFTEELSNYWSEQIKCEKFYLTVPEIVFQQTSPNPFEDYSWAISEEGGSELLKLKERITYLEGRLDMNNINYDK
jgi:hypothetical protein